MSRTLVAAASCTGASATRAARAQPHLVDRLLARDIGAAAFPSRPRRHNLKEERRFADAGIAADREGRTHDQAAAAHAIELGDAAPVGGSRAW